MNSDNIDTKPIEDEVAESQQPAPAHVETEQPERATETADSAAGAVDKTAETATDKPVEKRVRTSGKLCSLLGALFMALAWGLLMFTPWSWLPAAIGLVLSCFGIKGMSRGWRDLSTTSIVASGVLVLVFALFYFGLRIAFNYI